MFNLSAVYQLPFGPGQRYLSAPDLARSILGAWTRSTIATTQTGLPFNVTINRSKCVRAGDYAVSGEMRPDYVAGVPLTPPDGSTPDDWINAAAFAAPANQTFGDLGRNIFRAPGITDVDFAPAKDVSFSERMHLRFRADVFNILNRAQYGGPNAVLGQTNFGVITTPISSYATGRGAPREFQRSAKLSF